MDGLTRCVSCDPLYRLDGLIDVVDRSCRQVALGEATRIGNEYRFGVADPLAYGLAAIGNTLYMVEYNNNVLYALRYQ